MSYLTTGLHPSHTSERRPPSAAIDGPTLRARLIAAGVIRERVQTLPAARLPEGAVVVRLTDRDREIAASRVAQSLAGPRRWRDHLDGRAA